MDDPRLVALGLVPPPPGQEKAEESPAAPASTPDWQPLEQSQYVPQANPFSEAANTIPQYPDPFTTPLPPASAPPPAAPPQPVVPSIFNSPNSPFSFAPPAAAPVAPQAAPPLAPHPAPAAAPRPF